MIPANILLQNRYQIIRKIGQGGMGAVYEAVDQRLGHTVALKQIVRGDPAVFEQEARLLARLRHPALPKVSDHFLDDEGQFLVMDFIPGDDLATALLRRSQPFAVDEVLRWADQLLAALDYLHSQKPPIIHRDIKPTNLKFTARGQLVLLDFGLAKVHSNLTLELEESENGYAVAYAAPEQIRGENTDMRSDLYSVAATLHYLLTGARPPDAIQRAFTIAAGQSDPLFISQQANPSLSPLLVTILQKAMSLNPTHRFPDAKTFRVALRPVKQNEVKKQPEKYSLLTTKPTMTKTILFLAANPVDTNRLRLDEEAREVQAVLTHSRWHYSLQTRWAVRPSDLRRAMLETRPEIVHFSGHGTDTRGIFLEDDTGKPVLVSKEALTEFFSLFPDVKCVVLNSCYSELQAAAISQYVQYVIGMKNDIGDKAAIEFSRSFYDALGYGRTIDFAFQLSRNTMKLTGVDERLLPSLKVRTHWTITLDGSLNDLSDGGAEDIIEYLRSISGDGSLKLNSILSGSIILKLEGTKEGYKVIDALYKEGKLTELLGLRVKHVGYDNSVENSARPIELFLSYCHEDENLRSELVKHLSILQRNGVLSSWCDRQISAGEEWMEHIDERINSADIILLLISADFIASNYCWNTEVKRAMARHETGEARVIPVILRPVNWTKSPFGKLQALPKEAKPITTWLNRDEAFLNVSQGIEMVINQLKKDHV